MQHHSTGTRKHGTQSNPGHEAGSRLPRQAPPQASPPSPAPSPTTYRAARQRPVPTAIERVLHPPGPRLTALGSGLLAVGAMLLTGLLVQWSGERLPVFYGCVFVLVTGAAAVWVRPADLVTAPVAAPIAFAAGLLAAQGSGAGGMVDRVMAIGTDLALQAPWLYAGTITSVGVVFVRWLALLAVRQARRRQRSATSRRSPAPRPPREGHGGAPSGARR
ncbi:DUF6542 domain-containing protein [Streptomyces boninensis]|uniref:DUF6542 domain-containing protein n=1 Tax=Streptomyces boninensis TaxID=2039455 RepID=UPI003B2116B6